MKMKFYQLTEDQLNHLAMKALKAILPGVDMSGLDNACSRWQLCGIMIEVLNINLSSRTANVFVASVPDGNSTGCYGETQRQAIVRCFVAHTFGEDYETEL